MEVQVRQGHVGLRVSRALRDRGLTRVSERRDFDVAVIGLGGIGSGAAYAAWADLEQASGDRVIVKTGGIDLYPPDAMEWAPHYERSLDEVGLSYEWMDAGEAMRRWPQWRL